MALTAEVVTEEGKRWKRMLAGKRGRSKEMRKKSKAILGGKECDCGLVGVKAKTINSWGMGDERTGPVDQRRKREMGKDRREGWRESGEG